ncbi:MULTISPECIES: hypothetical protein [Serratia]|uniref:hypothetical protein n=1 Tax=Serratia TaxID=613 RepID=UPI00313AB8A8
METRLNIYYGLIVAAVTACFGYGLHWAIWPLITKGESWTFIFMMSGFVFLAISLALAIVAYFAGPFLALAFFAIEGLLRLSLWVIRWSTRRIRGVSAHPLP